MFIRTENTKDIPAIEDLILQAFYNHPHQDPTKGTVEHLIVQHLREAKGLTASLVAEKDHKIIGHIAFSMITINGEHKNYAVMAPVSVLPDYQNQGIGRALIETGLNALKEQNISGVVVLGDPTYYTRFGLHHDHALTVEGVPNEYFMALSLCDHSIPNGIVRFHPAFY